MANKLYVRGAAGDVAIADLGITIAQGPSWTLLNSSSPAQAEGETGQFTARELRDSADLYTAINGGSVEWSKDGTNLEVGSDYVADFTLMADFSDDTFDLSDGSLILPQAASTPASGVDGQIFWDNDSDSLYVWNGAEWVTIPVGAIDHGTLTGLGDDDHTQYALLTGDLVRNVFSGGVNFSTTSGLILPNGTSTAGMSNVEGNIMWDTDDNMLYLYDGANWISMPTMLSGLISHYNLTDIGTNTHANIDTHIADSSIHFTESSIDHTNIQNIGTNSHSDIDTHIADSSIHFTEASIDHGSISGLGDDDHPQYTAWAQDETISGVWTFDPASDKPNLVLDPRTVAPTTGNVDGAIAVIDDILSIYDSTRAKWLSVDRKFITGSKDGLAKDVYLRTDNIASSQTGIRALRDGTITGLFLQSDVASTWTLEIRRNGTVTVLASLASGGNQGAQVTTTNADFSAGDELQLYANTGGINITAPIGGMEIAWRF